MIGGAEKGVGCLSLPCLYSLTVVLPDRQQSGNSIRNSALALLMLDVRASLLAGHSDHKNSFVKSGHVYSPFLTP